MQRLVDIVSEGRNFSFERLRTESEDIEYEQKEVIVIDGKCPIIHYVVTFVNMVNDKYYQALTEKKPVYYFGIKIGDLFKYYQSENYDNAPRNDNDHLYEKVISQKLDYGNSPIMLFGGISGKVIINKLVDNYDCKAFANATVVFKNPHHFTSSQKNLQNYMTNFINTIHASIDIAVVQHLIDEYYMRNVNYNATVFFDEPKSLVEIIQIYHANDTLISQFAHFLTKKSIVKAYHGEPCLHNFGILRKWNKTDLWLHFISPKVFVNAHFMEWNPSNCLGSFVRNYMWTYRTKKHAIHKKIQEADETSYSSLKFTDVDFVVSDFRDEYGNLQLDEITIYSSRRYSKVKGYYHHRYNDNWMFKRKDKGFGLKPKKYNTVFLKNGKIRGVDNF